jgi:hypothetical protein
MNKQPEWLPPLINLSEYNGDWEEYEKALYKIFTNGFISSRPSFRGRPLKLKRYPLTRDKESTYWHLIQEGEVEEERTPDLRRCERLRWVRAVIENDADENVKVWVQRRNSRKRICMWLENEEYMVILDDRNKYLLLWTAFMVDRPHQKRKYRKEYEDWCKMQEK